MALETHTYLVPLVELEEDGEVTLQYKINLYQPDWDGSEETYWWAESVPADDPTYRFWRITCDAAIHNEIADDSDIDRI